MTVGGTWQPLTGAGIMMWKPTPASNLDETQQALSQMAFSEEDIQVQLNSSYDGGKCDSILPSVEATTTPSFMAEKHEQYRSPSIESTLSARSDNNMFSSDAHNHTPPSSPPLAECPWDEQLKVFADLSEEKTFAPVFDSALSGLPNSIASYEGGYVSDNTDRTDFLLDSPCPHIEGSRQPLQVFSSLQTIAKKSDTVVRRLDFGGSSKTHKQIPQKGLMATALEYSPPHRWTPSQRNFLCVLWRWYARDTDAFAQLFNAVHGLELPMRKVRDQFENYIRLHGGRAFPMYHEVYEATPFADPAGRYDSTRNLIEEIARLSGIELHRLNQEVTSPSGQAAKAKSALTRRNYKALVRRAKETGISPVAVQPSRAAVQTIHIGGFSLVTDDSLEVFSDVEDTPLKDHVEGTSYFKSPCLLFRVWDASSRTSFGPDGFVSSAFKEWSEIPPPIPPNDPYQVFKLLAHLHLSRIGDTPCFIAAAESLIQVLTIAASLNKPQIAVIDLNAPCMQQQHKTHLASQTLKWLKTDGKIKLPYRYQGHGDWFAHATIPQEAILKHFEVESLTEFCDHDDAAARMMNLEAFEPGLKTGQVASALRDRGTVLNKTAAGALGRLANLFLGDTRASLQHISAFIARIVDGWAIEKNDATDLHSLSSMAAAFATNFGSHSGCSRQDLMGAFLDGIDDGIKSAARWSRSGSGRRKMKRH
ncbi:hypothetical protein T440DRAFT_524729 [Plenodomus tracheiphilus IPT5]|uniref:DUF7587 domain-containing protein n=1 Tax=Plenodomus tracheiphilus IPT5 TaxID=1408161 RepID=A0A6A7BQG6_9PLEO|nr:hypothetical protein T440DRAFT_524729 [Plenodomus tracheiphilus IPT5]